MPAGSQISALPLLLCLFLLLPAAPGEDAAPEIFSCQRVQISPAAGRDGRDHRVQRRGRRLDGIPVTRIGDAAFFWRRSLTSVIIPDSVTSIGHNAFFGCNSLTAAVEQNSYALEYCKENDIPYTCPDSLDWLNN